MKTTQIQVLLIEDNVADAKFLQHLLAKSAQVSFEVTWVSRLAEGLEVLEEKGFDIVLLDLVLPDGQGLDTFRSLRVRSAGVPIIVLTGLDDEEAAFEAVAAGAQDYLVKGEIPGGLLVRAILYALERNEANEKIKQLNAELEDRIIQLAAANRRLEEANRVSDLTRDQALQASNFKSQFVAKMSHEIRTPIAALIGILDLMKIEESEQDQKELLRMADESAHCLLDVISDVLDLSKIEAGKIELQISSFSPTSLVEEVGELFTPTAQKKGLRTMTFIDPRIPSALEGDAIRLRQVLLNFTSNAVKCTEHGEIFLRATLESEDSEMVNVRFSVSDTGCGISDADRTKLFQPFVQLGSHQTHGTGLGLSICKRLVELMEGRIGVQSVAGKGSTFWMSLKLKRSPTTASVRAFHFDHGQQLLQSTRVLVLADNLTVRDIIHRYVGAMGLRNGSSASADEALDMIRRADQIDDPFKLVLVDLNSAEAYRFAAELNEDHSIASTPLVYIASSGQNNVNPEKIRKAGFAKCLREPIRQAQLVDTMVELLTKAKPESHASEAPSMRGSNKETSTQAITVLLAEDSEVIQKLVCTQLAKLGVSVTAVSNGNEALKEYQQGHYSLVLMDISMPVMNGLDAARAIRRVEAGGKRRTPIVALTARSMVGDRENCLEAGMDDYMTKPVTLEQLRQIMQRWTMTGPILY